MASTPCKGLKKDGTPCRGNGLDQLDGYCIAHAPADKALQWRSRGGKASSASRLPSCPQNFFARSLVNSRATLVHLSYARSCLSTPSTTAKRPPARSVCRHHARPSPAAASAVLRPRFPAQSLVHLSEISRPYLSSSVPACATFQPPPKGFQRDLCPPDATTPAAFPSHPSAVMRRKLFCPISRKLAVYLS